MSRSRIRMQAVPSEALQLLEVTEPSMLSVSFEFPSFSKLWPKKLILFLSA